MKKKIIICLILLLIISNLFPSNYRREIIKKLFKSIEKWIGTNYRLGGISKDGVDRSGLVSQVYKEVFDIDLPKSVNEQKKIGEIVTNVLQPGDILFFKINDSVSHVGIYLFNNKFIHAASSGPSIGVTKNSLNENYYKTKYAYAKRIIILPPYKSQENILHNNNENIIIFGKVLFRGNLLEVSDEFLSNNPIYLLVKIKNFNIYKILIIREYFDNIHKNENIANKIFQSNIDSNLHKIFLNKGFYIVKLYSNQEELLFEKTIIVK